MTSRPNAHEPIIDPAQQEPVLSTEETSDVNVTAVNDDSQSHRSSLKGEYNISTEHSSKLL